MQEKEAGHHPLLMLTQSAFPVESLHRNMMLHPPHSAHVATSPLGHE